MIIVKDSLAIILLGDWNNLYMQPEWIAKNVFKKDEIEIGVTGQENDVRVAFKCDNVIINPTQQRIMFSCVELNEHTIEYLSSCISNFLANSSTPQNISYGYNIGFYDSENMVLAEIVDGIQDSASIIDLGYEIKETKIHRTIEKDGNIINLDYSSENGKERFQFNEHHESENPSTIVISKELVNSFINETKRIMTGLGYELEE